MSDTEGSGASRAGGEAFHNEDALLVEDGLGLYVVCDGLSGRPGGEVAAGLAVEAVETFVSRARDEFGQALERSPLPTVFADRVVRYALDAVLQAARRDPALAGMKTTLTLLLVQGGQAVVGHAGDSRLYLARRGRLHQLTRDHELTQEIAAGSRAGSEAEDAAGEVSSEDLDVDTFAIDLRAGDTYILCTDGVEAVLDEDQLSRAALELPPHILASRIVTAAQRRDPESDATAVVVRVRHEHEPAWLALSASPRETSFGHVLAVA